MPMGGGFIAGSVVGKMLLDTTKWSNSVNKVKGDQKTMGGMSDKMAGRFKSAGKAMTIAGAAIVGSFGAMVGAAIKMNSEMANVATLIPGASERVLELKENVQDLAMATGKSTSDITGGLYQVISAFGDSAETAKILDMNVRAAAAGMATTTDAINLTSAVMKGYGDVSADATLKSADLAFMTVKLGQTTFPELAQSMGTAIPIAAALKVSQEELFASYATLTGVTGDAAKVSTQMRGVMTSMMKPSEDMAAAIEKLGYKTVEAMIADLGLVGAMRALVGTTDGTSVSVGKLFTNVRALPAVFALTGGQAKVFDEKLVDIKNSAGAMDEAFKEMSEGINKSGFDMGRLKQMTVVLAQRIGDNLAPVLGKLVVDIGKVVTKITDWIKEHPKLTEMIVKFTAGMGAAMLVLGPFMMMLPGIVLAVGKLKAIISSAMLAMKGWSLATAAAAAPVMILVGALAALTLGYLKVKKARDEANKSTITAAEQEGILEDKLAKAATAAGLSAKEFLDLRDAYKGNAAAMAMAIKKGKEGKELQEALTKVTTEQKEAYNEAKTATLDLGGAFEDNLIPAIKDAIVETQTFSDYLKDIGIKTIEEKKDRIAELEGHLDDLNQAYKDGKLTLIDYMKAVKDTEDEIFSLSTVIDAVALPAARDFGDVVAQAPLKLKSAVPEIKTEVEKLPSIFEGVSQRIKDAWTRELGEMLVGAKSFKDAAGAVWDEMKRMFADIVAKMVINFAIDGVKDLIGGATKAASGIGEAVSGIGSATAPLAAGIGTLITTLAQAIATAAEIIAASAPAILIAAGVALAIYAGFKIISSLFKKSAKPGSELDFLRQITENTFTIKDLLLGDYKAELHTGQNLLRDIIERTDSLIRWFDVLANIIKANTKPYLAAIADNTAKIAKDISKIGGAQGGAVLTEPKLMMTHGTPSNPEYILRKNQLVPAAAAAGGGAVNVYNHIHLNGTMISDRDYARNRLIPEMLSALGANYKKSDFKRVLGF